MNSRVENPLVTSSGRFRACRPAAASDPRLLDQQVVVRLSHQHEVVEARILARDHLSVLVQLVLRNRLRAVDSENCVQKCSTALPVLRSTSDGRQVRAPARSCEIKRNRASLFIVKTCNQGSRRSGCSSGSANGRGCSRRRGSSALEKTSPRCALTKRERFWLVKDETKFWSPAWSSNRRTPRRSPCSARVPGRSRGQRNCRISSSARRRGYRCGRGSTLVTPYIWFSERLASPLRLLRPKLEYTVDRNGSSSRKPALAPWNRSLSTRPVPDQPGIEGRDVPEVVVAEIQREELQRAEAAGSENCG